MSRIFIVFCRCLANRKVGMGKDKKSLEDSLVDMSLEDREASLAYQKKVAFAEKLKTIGFSSKCFPTKKST